MTSAVSGRTTILVVGQQPGFSKVSKARARPDCELLQLDVLISVIHGERSIGDNSTAPLQITGGFSSGYRMNSVAFTASAHQLAVAEGRISSGLRSQAEVPSSDEDDDEFVDEQDDEDWSDEESDDEDEDEFSDESDDEEWRPGDD